jgi:flagellar hook-associated protein 1 FlgK
VSGLLGSLSAVSRALDAQRFGLEVAGQNIANVNTAGYARREALLAPSAVADPAGAYGGVDVVGARATRDRLLERRLQMERPAERREAAIASSLSLVEVAIGRPGESLDAQMDTFFNWASQLAADPASTTLRHEFVASGERLAGAFREMVGRLQTAQRQADGNVRAAVNETNGIVSQLASVNAAIAGTTTEQATNQALLDRQKVLLDQLTAVIDVDVMTRADGGVDITTGSGRPLLLGSTAYAVEVVSAPPQGFADVRAGGQSVTSEITGGTLGGYLHVRDTLLPGYLDDLDSLASALAAEVNAIHTAGFDAAGVAGGAFFTLGAGVSAAGSIAVSADISADPRKVAAASVTVAGDNQNARALAALRDGAVLGGGTLNDAWARLVYRVGGDAQSAIQQQASRLDIVRQVEALQDAVAGVSLDEEAMTMMRFQRAYEANARFFQAINQAIETLLNMV